MTKSTDIQADLLVLGGGPGGYTAAFRAADLGLKVTLVEERSVLGGVCLNAGCIPSKALLESVKKMHDARELLGKGIHFDAPRIHLDELRNWKNEVVSTLAGGLSSLAKLRKVTIIQGRGRFVSPQAVDVEATDGKGTGNKNKAKSRVTFKQAIIAVGSRPVTLPFLPQDPRIMDSTGALELNDIPKRLLIIGGGIIGLEMATVYSGLGSRVTIVEQQPRLIPPCDPDLVAPLEKRLRPQLEQVLLGTSVSTAKALPNGIEVQFKVDKASSTQQSSTQQRSTQPNATQPLSPQLFDRVLVAVGRRSNADGIDLAKAGIKLEARDLIKVDRQQRTIQPHIFAIGDVVGEPMLAHKAVHEGRVAAEVAAGMKVENQVKVIPNVAYTDPEVAWVGMTETEATQKGIQWERGSFPWMASGRAHALGRTDGITKVIVDAKTHQILGVGMVGTHAGDLVSEAALAIESGLEAGDIALTVHPHPTLSETLSLAAEALEGTLTELYPARRK